MQLHDIPPYHSEDTHTFHNSSKGQIQLQYLGKQIQLSIDKITI